MSSVFSQIVAKMVIPSDADLTSSLFGTVVFFIVTVTKYVETHRLLCCYCLCIAPGAQLLKTSAWPRLWLRGPTYRT